MPNIVAQRIDNTGIWIRSSNGKEITITKADIQERYATTTGNRNARRAALILWAKEQIVSQLGSDLFEVSRIVSDFDDSNGNPADLTIIS